VDLWLELQLNGRAQLHYWRNEPALGMAVLEASRPVVETRGSVGQKKTFYDSLVMQAAPRDPLTGSTTRSLPTSARPWPRRRSFAASRTSPGRSS